MVGIAAAGAEFGKNCRGSLGSLICFRRSSEEEPSLFLQDIFLWAELLLVYSSWSSSLFFFTQLLVVMMQGYIGIYWHTLAHLGIDLGVGFVNLSGDDW